MHSDLFPLGQAPERREVDDTIPGRENERRKADNSKPALHYPAEGMEPGGDSSDEEDPQDPEHREEMIRITPPPPLQGGIHGQIWSFPTTETFKIGGYPWKNFSASPLRNLTLFICAPPTQGDLPALHAQDNRGGPLDYF